LDYRENIRAMKLGARAKINDEYVTLLSSGHMLGGVQVAVRLSNGMRLGYSSDFHWPLDKVIRVDALVVDSTYGSPESVRKYTQAEVESRLVELVIRELKRGPVHILSHRGTLQRALQLLSTGVNCPLLGSPRFCADVTVYRECGYGIGDVLAVDSSDGKKVMSRKRYARFYSKGDGFPVELEEGTTITLSAFMTQPDNPVLQHSDRSFRVALSNHADFYGTLEYVRATGAKCVLTDNTRGGHAIELAREIKSRLGVEARPSASGLSHEWGV
jgi:putative mRNA 3-end processing factor